MVAFVQQMAGAINLGGSTTTVTVSITANTTKGNRIILAFKDAGGRYAVSATDSQSNSWSVDEQGARTGSNGSIASAYLATALTTSDHITVTWSASTSTTTVIGYEFSGIVNSGAIDVVNSSSGSSALSGSCSVTPGSLDELAFSCLGLSTTQTSVTAPTDFTLLSHTGESAWQCAAAYDIGPTPAASLAANWSWGTSAGTYGIAVVTYKQATVYPSTNITSQAVNRSLTY